MWAHVNQLSVALQCTNTARTIIVRHAPFTTSFDMVPTVLHVQQIMVHIHYKVVQPQ